MNKEIELDLIAEEISAPPSHELAESEDDYLCGAGLPHNLNKLNMVDYFSLPYRIRTALIWSAEPHISGVR